MSNPKPQTSGSRPPNLKPSKVPLGVWIHRRVFAEAARVHPECLGNDELLAAIRKDIVKYGIARKPSLSALSAFQKICLVNRYLEMQGVKFRVKAPAKYDPQRRARSSRPANPDALPTPDQRAEMVRLFDRLGYPKDEGARQRFCERQCGRRTPATRRDAAKVIDGLKAMDSRGWRWGQCAAVGNNSESEG